MPVQAPEILRKLNRPTPEQVEAALIGLPQVHIEIINHFAEGVLVREMIAPAGAWIVGHEHRHDGINILLTGKALVLVGDRELTLEAPQIIHSKAHTRKMAYVIEEMRWLNVHGNPDNEQSMEVLEDRYIIKSDLFLEHETEINRLRAAAAKLKESE